MMIISFAGFYQNLYENSKLFALVSWSFSILGVW